MSLLSSRGVFVRKQSGVQTSPEQLDQISWVSRASNRGTDGYAGMTKSRNPGVGVHFAPKETLREGGQDIGLPMLAVMSSISPWEGG
jgi:hypothetical protein